MKLKNLLFCCGIGLFSFTPPIAVKSKITDKYDIIVAQDGSGNFTTIESAIESCKSFPYKRINIFIKNGVYHEKVLIPAWNTKISITGESRDSTIITFGDYFGKIKKGPNSTFYTATLVVQANDFDARNITIENSAGPVGQALAVSVTGDRCSFENCHFSGAQDTLYAAGENARQYYSHCYIDGTTDFIFGEATAVFDYCTITCKSDSYITAASTPENARYGFVFRHCLVKAAPGITKVYLGRPWRKYARTVFIHCSMGRFIQLQGWAKWKSPDNERTVYYAEYKNTGEGAIQKQRASWTHQLTAQQAARYSIEQIFAGTIKWNPLLKNQE